MGTGIGAHFMFPGIGSFRDGHLYRSTIFLWKFVNNVFNNCTFE